MKKFKENRKLVWALRYIITIIVFAVVEFVLFWIEGSIYAVNKQPWVIAIIVAFVIFLGIMLTLSMFMRQENFRKEVEKRTEMVKCSWTTYNATPSAKTSTIQKENENDKNE